ncbi:hypothetical protein F5I97DRAFT_1799933, partial [Phlebopus sp. FC_14]
IFALGVSEGILTRYQTLSKKHLKVSFTVTDPNGRGHRDENLAWFRIMNIPQDMNSNNWMSEYESWSDSYLQVHELTHGSIHQLWIKFTVAIDFR